MCVFQVGKILNGNKMTLNIVWRDPGSRVHFFSDSRVNLGSATSDFGIKLTRMPYNIYGPVTNGQPADLLQCGDIAITFAGHSVLPLMIKETLAEILYRVQVIPGYSRYDMDALSKLIFHAFEIIAKDADFKTYGAINVGIIFGGWCETARKHRIYKMEVTQDTRPSLTEILVNPDSIEVMGSGKVEAERLLSGKPLNQKTIFGVLKAVIDDPAVNTVGGNMQYGDLNANRFRLFGMSEVENGQVHYWRGMLDLNSEEFTNSMSLVPNFPSVDLEQLMNFP